MGCSPRSLSLVFVCVFMVSLVLFFSLIFSFLFLKLLDFVSQARVWRCCMGISSKDCSLFQKNFVLFIFFFVLFCCLCVAPSISFVSSWFHNPSSVERLCDFCSKLVFSVSLFHTLSLCAGKCGSSVCCFRFRWERGKTSSFSTTRNAPDLLSS